MAAVTAAAETVAAIDLDAMREAIALSARGFPAPNPHVGCVIQDAHGQIVGRGWHEAAGQPHAEAMALAEAGDRARGGTAYVTLEPCDHHGRTPPCSLALIAAGVARVVVACPDPNPVAAGGAARLRAAGISVELGVLESEAAAINWRFLTAMRQARPAVVVKAALTLDGRIAWPSGESKWITGPEARTDGHRLRAEMGCVLVGRGTVAADDPHLTARIYGVKNAPVRVVLDPHARLSGREHVFDDAAATWWLTTTDALGAICLPDLTPATVLGYLRAQGVTGVLVEGGGVTIRHFLAAGLVDRLALYVAPRLFGAGRLWLPEGEPWSPPHGVSLELLGVTPIGQDLRLDYSVSVRDAASPV